MAVCVKGALIVWAVFVGSVVGAGFASGEEVLSFFAVYGASGLMSSLAAGVMLALLGARLMRLAQRAEAEGHGSVLRLLFGSYARCASCLLSLFWLVMLSVMLSGAGALFAPYVPPALSSSLLALLLCALSVRGRRAVLSANLVITPLVLSMLCGAVVWSLFYHRAELSALAPAGMAELSVPAFMSCLLYVSYNLAMCVPALSALPALTKGAVRSGAALAGMTLSLLLSALFLVVHLHYEEAMRARLPMLLVASMQHDACFAGYAAVLVLAMVTSGLSALIGASRLFAPYVPSPLGRTVFLLAAAVLVGQAGFSVLVETVLPLLGALALVLMLRLCLPVR